MQQQTLSLPAHHRRPLFDFWVADLQALGRGPVISMICCVGGGGWRAGPGLVGTGQNKVQPRMLLHTFIMALSANNMTDMGKTVQTQENEPDKAEYHDGMFGGYAKRQRIAAVSSRKLPPQPNALSSASLSVFSPSLWACTPLSIATCDAHHPIPSAWVLGFPAQLQVRTPPPQAWSPIRRRKCRVPRTCGFRILASQGSRGLAFLAVSAVFVMAIPHTLGRGRNNLLSQPDNLTKAAAQMLAVS
ncbi:hypothetical protein ACJZ2D_003939 [Fusarium nematophilum]